MIRGGRLVLGVAVLATLAFVGPPTSGAHVDEQAAKRPPAIRFIQEPKRNRIRIVAPGYELQLSVIVLLVDPAGTIVGVGVPENSPLDVTAVTSYV